MKSRYKYMWLLVFQVVLVILFFIFVEYDGDKEHDVRGYEDTHVMIYIGFGFLMTFLKRYCYGAVGINLLLAALVAQWSIITQGVFHLHHHKIWLNKKLILEADIMAATVLITFGALLGRANVNQLLAIAIIEALVGSINLYLVSEILKAADIGGSMAIHAYGAFFGIAVSGIWNCRWKKRQPEPERGARPAARPPAAPSLEGPSYASDVTSMIGSIFLFVYWPSFNSALAASAAEYQRAVVNTYLSLAACAVVTFVLSAFVSHGKFEMEHIQNSTLAGGVGVGSVCNMHLTAGGAIIVGMGAAFISVFGFSKFKPFLIRKFGLRDTCGVMHLHGLPGVYSGLISVVVAAAATINTYGKKGYEDVFPAEGRSAPVQGIFQLLALIVTIVIALTAGIITGLLTKLAIFKPLKTADHFKDEPFWEIPA